MAIDESDKAKERVRSMQRCGWVGEGRPIGIYGGVMPVLEADEIPAQTPEEQQETLRKLGLAAPPLDNLS